MTSTDNKSARRQWLLAAGGVALTSAVGSSFQFTRSFETMCSHGTLPTPPRR